MANIKRIGVLTSGGDAPGMNAAVRAVVRTALALDIECIGIRRGWQGLITGDFVRLTSGSVGHILSRGGTILFTARSEDFMTEKGRQRAVATCKMLGLDGIVAIGGDGTFRGALELSRLGIPVAGVPATIDNDIGCTNYTIGFDSACNTAIECIDKLRDTATSHERVFLVEVMGRDAGFLTLNAAIAGGCEAAIIPERAPVPEQIEEAIGSGRRKSKNSSIVLVQEHAVEGGAKTVAEIIEKAHPEYSTRVTVLGHLQRGGSPSAYDRILASRMGVAAVQALLDGQRNVMVGIQNDDIVLVPLTKAIHQKKDIKEDSWEALQTLSI